MTGTEAYAAAVAQTIARLAAAQGRAPVAQSIKADASKVEHYCRACGLSWRGPAPCWGCGAEGVERCLLPDNERALWIFSNTSSGTFTEGEPPCESF